jgi:hypothetical protein
MACADDVMNQETAFLGALEGAALVERRGETLVLRDRNDDVVVAMSKPQAEAEASASPIPTEEPAPSPTPSASATERPSPTPAPEPTPTPTPKPTAAPTLPPPPSAPPTAACTLTSPSGAQLASIVYPQSWFTVTEPPEAACQYFDPNPITVPADPGTLDTAIAVRPDVSSYSDAVAAATDPANWTVVQTLETTVSDLPATLVEATSTTVDSGTPVGTTLYSYFIDYGDGGTLSIQTSGVVGEPAYAMNTVVASLMAQASTFTPSPAAVLRPG